MLLELGGVPVEKDSRLPLSKIDAVCLPKNKHVVNREFWLGTDNMVWGYFDDIGYFDHKVYLSGKAFEKLMNADLTTNINE